MKHKGGEEEVEVSILRAKQRCERRGVCIFVSCSCLLNDHPLSPTWNVLSGVSVSLDIAQICRGIPISLCDFLASFTASLAFCFFFTFTPSPFVPVAYPHSLSPSPSLPLLCTPTYENRNDFARCRRATTSAAAMLPERGVRGDSDQELAHENPYFASGADAPWIGHSVHSGHSRADSGASRSFVHLDDDDDQEEEKTAGGVVEAGGAVAGAGRMWRLGSEKIRQGTINGLGLRGHPESSAITSAATTSNSGGKSQLRASRSSHGTTRTAVLSAGAMGPVAETRTDTYTQRRGTRSCSGLGESSGRGGERVGGEDSKGRPASRKASGSGSVSFSFMAAVEQGEEHAAKNEVQCSSSSLSFPRRILMRTTDTTTLPSPLTPPSPPPIPLLTPSPHPAHM